MTNQTDQQLMWRATCDLGDWFSRMGGGARYGGMKESDIFLYVAASAAEKAYLILDRKDYITNEFAHAAKNAAEKADHRLSQLQSSKVVLEELVRGYIDQYDRKLENERSPEWIRFCQDIKEITNG